ncbi:hypothetical protein [Kitasatospora purpeofusca]|uniref:hypothetical protein n=1 Tax=Kitasatospora purpeofusca TaxID=67352 RepID=UPI003F4AC8A6
MAGRRRPAPRVPAETWWIGIDTHYPYTRTQPRPGRAEEASTFADVSALLSDPVDANDRTALVRAAQELRKRLHTPPPPTTSPALTRQPAARRERRKADTPQ